MHCKFCKEENENAALFCKKCGAKLNEPEKNDNENNATVANKRISDKTVGILKKLYLGSFIAGCLGATMFLLIVLIGLIIYGRIYLFDGYDFTKVLTIISIVLMIIGLCGFICKLIFNFILKIGKFPSKIFKSLSIILIAIACLGFSVWGFVDCNKNNKPTPSTSTGGSSTETDYTVSKYLGLELNVTNIKKSGSYAYVYCTIENVSSLYGIPTMYRYIKVKAIFKDIRGNIIDTDWTYAIDSVWLNSGETKTFYFMVNNTNVYSASLSIL